MTRWHALFAALQQWEWLGMLLARLAVGILFAISGGTKLFIPARRDQMRETLRDAGVPSPEAAASVVSWIEFASGALLAVGFLTPLACIVLLGVMLGALVTTVIPHIQTNSLIEWLGDFLYAPEVLYVVILVWLLFAGPGWLSLDWLVFS